jgi:hypothetical protein
MRHWLLFTLMVCLSWCHRLLNTTQCHGKKYSYQFIEFIMVVFLENAVNKEDI